MIINFGYFIQLNTYGSFSTYTNADFLFQGKIDNNMILRYDEPWRLYE